MKRFLFLIAFLILMTSTANAGEVFRTGRFGIGGETIAIGMSFDKTLLQHAQRDFGSTMMLNGVQALFIKNPDKRNKILGRTTVIITTFIVAFELGQSNAGNHYVGLADIGVGLLAHFLSNKISKIIFKL